MRKLYLYTTGGCHLCEQAEALVLPLLAGAQLQLVPVEITESPALVERYGVRIPVVRLEGAQRELGWPFDERMLEHYLHA